MNNSIVTTYFTTFFFYKLLMWSIFIGFYLNFPLTSYFHLPINEKLCPH